MRLGIRFRFVKQGAPGVHPPEAFGSVQWRGPPLRSRPGTQPKPPEPLFLKRVCWGFIGEVGETYRTHWRFRRVKGPRGRGRGPCALEGSKTSAAV